MEVYRRSSWLLLLLGISFLATTLQGVQGEVESEGPSESQCRPYIEKALKELEAGEAVLPGHSTEAGDSKEDIPTVEITTDDSDHEPVAGEDEAEEGEGDEDAEVEAETVDAHGSVEEDKSEEQAEETHETKSEEEQVAEEQPEGETEASEEQAAETGESSHESVEEKEDAQEAENTSGETEEKLESAETKEEESEEVIEKRSAAETEEDDATQEAKESAEAETEEVEHKESEEAASVEEHDEASKEEVAAEESGETAEEGEEAKEETVEESVEEGKESVEEGKESVEEEKEHEDEGAAESVEETTEEGSEETPEPQTEADAVAEEETEEETEEADAEKEGKEEEEKDDESGEVEAKEGAETTEESVEETTEPEAESVEQVVTETVSEDASEETEEKVEHDKEGSEEEVDEQDEHSGESAETTEETAGEVHEEEQKAEDVTSEEATPEAAKDEGTSEEGDEEKGDEPGDASKEEEEEKPQEDAPAEEAEEEVEGEEGAEPVVEEKEVLPEEELTLEMDIPTDLRSRDHVYKLLKLDEESSETEKIINRVSDITLRDLKKLYENAIKPLETLYKYRDLSNRHFGDSEIFSKPLVLFMGPWSGGKSSIINYLLDNEYKETSLRTGAEPSPAYFNLLMHGDESEVLDGTQLAADFTFSGLQKFGQGLEERLRGLKLPNKLLEKINIVEIPGILEVRKQVSRVFPFNDACQWFIDRADIIFLVYDPSKLDVGPETEAILDQLKGREYQTRIILNKADQVKPEELMRVQGALIWNISPLMSSAQPPVMYTTSLWSRPYEPWAPVRLLQAQERAFLRDLRSAIDKRIDNKISSARRFAVRVRNHAKMVDCYLTTYYNHKSVFGNKKLVSDQIIEHPQDYHIYEGLSTLTNISRYDLPDPEVYRGFFKLNPLYDFQQLSATCTYFRGCPINRLDVAIAYDLPELVGKHKRLVEAALAEINQAQTPGS